MTMLIYYKDNTFEFHDDIKGFEEDYYGKTIFRTYGNDEFERPDVAKIEVIDVAYRR